MKNIICSCDLVSKLIVKTVSIRCLYHLSMMPNERIKFNSLKNIYVDTSFLDTASKHNDKRED